MTVNADRQAPPRGPHPAATLESILKQMREAEERRQDLQRQHAEVVSQLQNAKHSSGAGMGGQQDQRDTGKAFETIEALQSKIRELEKKTELQNVRHEELLLEMATMKRSAGTSPGPGTATPASAHGTSSGGGAIHHSIGVAPNATVHSSTTSAGFTGDVLADPKSVDFRMSLLTDASTCSSPATGCGLQRTPSSGVGSGVAAASAPFPGPHPSQYSSHPHQPLQHPLHHHPPSTVMWKMVSYAGLPTDLSTRPHSPPTAGTGASAGSATTATKTGGTSNVEIDRIMAKIEQDNRILAELDKTRSTIGGNPAPHVHVEVAPPATPLSPPTSTPPRSRRHTGARARSRSAPRSAPRPAPRPAPRKQHYLTVPRPSYGRHSGQHSDSAHTTTTASARSGASTVSSVDPLGLHHHHSSAVTALPLTGLSTLPCSMSHQPGLVQPLAGYLPLLGPSAPRTSAFPSLTAAPHQPRVMPQIPGIPAIVTTQYDVDRVFPLETQHLMGGSAAGKVDMLDIPGKGRCYVYIARYSYEPFQQSPNENPEAELPVNAGDYLLIWGNMDEDGFFDGELLDGRRGLVPSNFIQKLVGEDLLEFHQSVVLGLRDCDDCASTTLPQDLDFSMGHEYFGCRRVRPRESRKRTPRNSRSRSRSQSRSDRSRSRSRSKSRPRKHDGIYGKRDYTYMDFDDMMEDEDDMDTMGEGPVPAPKQLTLERQLNKSVLIGWNPPDNCPAGAIDSYHLYVDGVLKATVKATERTRALVEGVDSTRPHRISVRSITPNRRTSRDAACTMVIGKDIPLGPTRVKASHVTSTSAVISWLPSNSNHQHVVCVNNVELRTVKPGVYRHTITGLAPDTVYRVTVRAKNIRAPHFDEKHHLPMERYSCHIDFVTLPKGLPDPPAEIQVEPGPQDGTLLVTWLPVTANMSPNSSLVTGYAVYADGKKVTDVDSPTGDHALIDIGKLIGINPRQVTVRTKSRDAQSADSPATPIPASILRGKGHSKDGRGIGGAAASSSRYGTTGHHTRQGHGQPHRGTRMDSHGQVVIETDENLSDKEVYPSNSMSIPSIEITKDTASEGNFSEDDYDNRRRGHGPYDQRPAPRSHAERERPPLLPHERARNAPHRDERDQYYPDMRHGRGGMGAPGPGGSAGGSQPFNRMVARSVPPKRVRTFVGLIDYDPQTMSPNPDGCYEELAFSEGEKIKIYGEKDPDGFYWGEVRGRQGFVPENTVEEITDRQGDYARGGDRWGASYPNTQVRKMIALYDYDPQELSPNVDADVELSFRTGNVIYTYGEMDDDGFYMGEIDGCRGLVPSNFLTEAPEDYRNGTLSVRGPQRGGPGRSMAERGHGPGARGPPPPPRDGMPPGRMDPRDPRDRRKDGNFPQPSQLGYHQQGPAGGPPGGPRGRGDPRDRRGGRGGQWGQGGRGYPPGGYMDAEYGPGGPGGPPNYGPGGTQGHQQQPMQQQQQIPPQQQQQQNQQQQRQHQMQQAPMKGVPKVVPDFVIPNNKESPTTTTTTTKFPEAPNLMQKLGDLTAGLTGGGDNPADNLISKGKELIFMKFGLGGGK